MEDLVHRADLIEQPFKNVRGRQYRRNPRDKQQGQAKVFEGEIYLEEERQKKADGELEQDAKKREQDRVDDRSPEYRVGNGGQVLRQLIDFGVAK